MDDLSTDDRGRAPTLRLLLLAAGLAALAALPALGAATAWVVWLAAVGALVVAITADCALAPAGRRLALHVEVPERVAVGSEAAIDLRLAWSPGQATEATLDLDPLFRPFGVQAVAPAGLPTTLPLLAQRRGRGKVESLWLRYEGPLRLVRRTVRVALDREVEAVPDLALVRGVALAASASRDAPMGSKVERFAGDGSEFHALRAFQPGLDRRSIDWKASARHRRLLAREVRAERNHQIVLAIDTGRLMAEPVDGMPLLDHAIHAALGLAWVALSHGDRVGLYGFDQTGHTHSGARAGTRSLHTLLELSAGLDYSEIETNFTRSLSALAGQLHRRALIIVLTDFVDTVSAELMVENLNRLSRRHLVVFVTFRDPELDRIALAPPRSVDDVERATVADVLLQEREVVLRRLARAGIQAIDARPRDVGSRLINRYLDIKRRERI